MKANIRNNRNENSEDNFASLPNITQIAEAHAIKTETTTELDSKAISDAVLKKTVVKDEKNKRILALTDTGVIEFDNKTMLSLSMTARNIVEKFKVRVKNGSVNIGNVVEILKYFECINAAFVETPDFEKSKKELNRILLQMKSSDSEETRQILKLGLFGFFEASKQNIIFEKRTFQNIPFAINNGVEKEFLRQIYISELFADGLVDYSFLVESGVISNMEQDAIEELYRKDGLLTPEEIENAYYLSDTFENRDEILEYYIKNDKKYFITFATSEEVARFVIAGKISVRDCLKKLRIEDIKDFSPEFLEEFLSTQNFPKNAEFIEYRQEKNNTIRCLSNRFLKALDRERFLKIVLSEKIQYQKQFTSEDYISEYGKLSTDDIISLQEAGLIKPEDVIKLTKYKSVQTQNPEEYEKMLETQLSFYDLDRLEDLIKTNRINKKFVEQFNTLLSSMISEKQRRIYIEKLNIRLNEKENADELITDLVHNGFTFGTQVDYELSPDFVSEMFLEDRITEQDVFMMYQSGCLITSAVIRNLYSDHEIIELYESKKVDYRVLALLENRTEVIKEELAKGRLSSNQFINLYATSSGLTNEEFLMLAEEYDFGEERLVEYLPDEVSIEKVETLFNNYYISQDDLSILVGRNVITQKQAEEFATKIATHEQYESIFNLDNRFVILTKDTDGQSTGGGGNGGVRPSVRNKSKLKNDPELQDLLLEQIGFDSRILLLKGANNSLDGYRVYPSEEFGIMVFLKNDKPGNATYIMSLQQGLFFLNKMTRDNKNSKSTTTVLESDATKQELRETEHVKVRNAAPNWGGNVITDMKKLSPSFRAKLKEKDEVYMSNIDELVEDIKKDYFRRRDEQR